jgi:hypothetical protein
MARACGVTFDAPCPASQSSFYQGSEGYSSYTIPSSVLVDGQTGTARACVCACMVRASARVCVFVAVCRSPRKCMRVCYYRTGEVLSHKSDWLTPPRRRLAKTHLLGSAVQFIKFTTLRGPLRSLRCWKIQDQCLIYLHIMSRRNLFFLRRNQLLLLSNQFSRSMGGCWRIFQHRGTA